MKPVLLFLSGSLRRQSLNGRLAKIAQRIAVTRGAEARFIDLPAYDIPLFNEDVVKDQGFHPGAKEVKEAFQAANGVFIASPEYNGAYTGALKNVFDWISRRETPDEPSLSAFAGKAFVISSVSPGKFGGLRGLIALRALLGGMDALTLPAQLAIGGGAGAFTEEGLADPAAQAELERAIASLIRAARALHEGA